MPLSAPREFARFHQADGLGGLELLSARFIEHRFAPHVHDSYVIALVEAGAERYRYRGAEHLVPAGSFALLNPDEVHTGYKGGEQGWRYRVFYPEVGLVRELLDELGMGAANLPMFQGNVHADGDLALALGRLHRLLEEPRASLLQRQTLWREVMLELLRRHARLPEPGSPGGEPRAVALARELLASRLDAPPSLAELAAAVNLSPFHLSRVFRRATGLPPHAWLLQRRLERARHLLKRGCAAVQVAALLGYADQSHLVRQFKQAYGVTPGEYRRACRSR